jgi:2-polyprenyl-6-methoxyphenol hydroxylase-like FAD-dependent oxidoreductase
MRSALVCGAGIAGATVAWQLAARGVHVTVVEKAAGQRSSGNPVDVHGEAMLVARQMAVDERVRDAATGVRRLVALDPSGRRVATIAADSVTGGAEGVEVPRADLAGILLDAAKQRANVVFDDSIARLEEHPGGVGVEFESGSSGRFDIVIGADGQHSRVRALAFGPEGNFSHRIGMFVGTVSAPGATVDLEEMTMVNAPGVSFSLHPSTGVPIGAFIFHSALAESFDHRDTAQHRRIVADAYSDVGWRVPEFVERFVDAPEVYFDTVTQMRLGAWHRGRIVLLGDSASSVSLFGDGSSLAMIGARTLAEALADHADPADAFAEYERRHRMLVMPKQKRVRTTASQLVPKTAAGLGVRNLALRGIQAYSGIRRRVHRPRPAPHDARRLDAASQNQDESGDSSARAAGGHAR